MLNRVVTVVFLLLFCHSHTATAFYSNNSYGDAVVILSTGRGGSAWFCEVARQTDPQNEATFVHELFGYNDVIMKRNKNPTDTMVTYFKAERKKHPKGFVGFKWKPMIQNEKYEEAMDYVAKHKIPMLYLTRNLLDHHVSSLKHAGHRVDDHCKVDDKKCVEKHLKQKVKIDASTLLERMERDQKSQDKLLQKLKDKKIPHVHVSYDHLGFGPMEEKRKLLQRVVDIMYPGSGKVCDVSVLETKYEVTTDRDQSHTISNYAEVIAALNGTRFEYLLRHS